MNKKYIVFFLLIISLIVTGCSYYARNITKTEQEINRENRFKELELNGDNEFNKMYWTGWTNAIRIYEAALRIKDSGTVREKMFFALLHIAIRSRFFFLPGESYLKRAEDLLAGLKERSKGISIFYRITRMNLFPDEPYLISDKDLKILRSYIKVDYKYYFFILHNRRKMELRLYRQEQKKMLRLFPDSNLKYFLRDKFIEINKGIRENPDFIELLITKGDRFFSTGNFKKAGEYYSKVLQYDKRASVALTGLGNIYNYFELYKKALEYYRRSSDVTPLYYKALFGQAVCLSQLGEIQNSIQVLTTMLDNDLWYKGEVYYYRALNNFILKEYSKVEPDLKNSESFIPDSLELHTLAGMFYFETKRYKRARQSFKKSISLNNRYPRPYYYLGYLDIHKKDIKNSLLNFSLAGIYYLEMIDRNIQSINNLNKLNISKDRLEKIRTGRFKRLRSKIDEIITKMKNVILMLKNLKEEKIRFLYKIIDNLKLKKQLSITKEA